METGPLVQHQSPKLMLNLMRCHVRTHLEKMSCVLFQVVHFAFFTKKTFAHLYLVITEGYIYIQYIYISIYEGLIGFGMQVKVLKSQNKTSNKQAH